MLNSDALSQLKSLKKDIYDSVPRHEGKVRATSGRYGFVNTDDKQQFFLSPDEMDKVLSQDCIAFRVEEAKDGKKQAIIEKLLSTEQDTFIGQYQVKGKGHFVAPDHPTFSRWVFIPPAKRQGAKHGDLVRCQISKHPYPHGKVQADVLAVLGQVSDKQIESRTMSHKWQLAGEFDEHCVNEAQSLLSVMDEATAGEPRTDLTELPWLTIDSAMSRDLDDALYCQSTDTGWQLQVAIADPSCVVKPGSELDKAALKRATSSYFIDDMIPMLPSSLSEEALSLLPGQRRPALVCQLSIDSNGHIQGYELLNALVESKAKLSYAQVGGYLQSKEASHLDASSMATIDALQACTQALNAQRREQHLVLDDKLEFRSILNDQGKIDQIIPFERNGAHKLVEECMVAANRSVADFLARQSHGLFVQHGGIRAERQGEARALVKEQLGMEQPETIATLEGFVALQKQIANTPNELPLQAIIARQLERSQLGTQAKPHVGMGLTCYTTFTSPLRKYNDLLVHRLVKAVLAQQSLEPIADSVLEAISQGQNNSRMAAWQAEQWLKAEWLQRQVSAGVITGPQNGQIVQVHSGGFNVRLDCCGIEGLVEIKRGKPPSKGAKSGSKSDAAQDLSWKFDTKTMTHSRITNHGQSKQPYRLEQKVQVEVADIKPAAREVRFSLIVEAVDAEAVDL